METLSASTSPDRRSGMRRAFAPIAFIVLALAACCAAPRANAQAPQDDKQSCQDFVQKFYDWYWNSLADQKDMPGLRAHSLQEVIKLKPPVLSPDLLRLLKKEVRAGGIGKLDMDPFLANDTPHGKYTVSKVEITGDYCRATIDAGHEIAALKKSGPSWVFADFHYSYFYEDGTKRDLPDTDLISLLTL